MLLQQLRSGKRSKQRYGLLGGARPLRGSKKKAQREAAGFQKNCAQMCAYLCADDRVRICVLTNVW